MTAFEFVREGESYSGGPLYRVETPAGVNIGYVASSSGKRGKSWMAWTPLTLRTVVGFQNRERAAEFLQRVVSES